MQKCGQGDRTCIPGEVSNCGISKPIKAVVLLDMICGFAHWNWTSLPSIGLICAEMLSGHNGSYPKEAFSQKIHGTGIGCSFPIKIKNKPLFGKNVREKSFFSMLILTKSFCIVREYYDIVASWTRFIQGW